MDDSLRDIKGPFDPDARCIKCGGEDIWAQWKSGGWPNTCSTISKCWLSVSVEHIHRGCRRCHYEWIEAPLDSPVAQAVLAAREQASA